MPATRLDRARRREPLRELIAGRMVVADMSTEQLGAKLGWSPSTSYRKIKDPDGWTLRDIKTACRVLGVPVAELREKIQF